MSWLIRSLRDIGMPLFYSVFLKYTHRPSKCHIFIFFLARFMAYCRPFVAVEKGIEMKQKGLTLIELMVVVAILGILVTLAVPAYRDHAVKARVSEGLFLTEGAKLAVS